MSRSLRRLDDAWVPSAARRWQRLVARVRGGGGADLRGGHTVARAISDEPALVGSIAAVLVAGILIAAAGGKDAIGTGSSPTVVPSAAPPALVATLGPAPGDAVSTYLTRAAYDLRHFGDIAAGRPTYAVVDLRRYETAAQAMTTFNGTTVVRAYVRVPSRLPTQVRSVPVNGIRDLPVGMSQVAQVAAATAKSYAALLATFHPKSAADRLTRRSYRQQRRAALFEAPRLGHPATCRCVFAVVVRADITRLAALTQLSDVRVVDPASPVIPIAGLTVRPLVPEATTVVPRTGLLGG